ncbi:MAG: response regulator, partial [Oceanospirillum sp.]|nr:response regulator [Oceanospirillum sp.]
MTKPYNVWIVDDDRSIRWVLERSMEQEGMSVKVFERAEGVLKALSSETPDAMITDIR